MDPAAGECQLTELLESRAERHGIAAAWLFGSVARGTAGPESDVDVAILLSEDPPRTLAGLNLDLESELELELRVPDERLGEPRTNREVFELLAKNGWVPRELGETLGRMAGLRNILVHGYEVVDPAILREVVERELDDLLAFAGAIRRRLDR